MQRTKLLITLCFVVFAAAFFIFKPGISVKGTAGGASLASPTGFTASDSDYATKVGLHWQPVRGATVYRVFRNVANDPATANEVGSTPANYFFDSSAVAGQTYFFWVRAENAQSNSGFSNGDQGTRAIGEESPGPPFPPLQPPFPPGGNPVTAAKAYLGKALFWDEQLY